MSGACSPGGEMGSPVRAESPEGRESLVSAAVMLRERRPAEADEMLAGMSDSTMARDWRVRKVREILQGTPSPLEMDRASNLLTRTAQDYR
jgi:hypothetical protein